MGLDNGIYVVSNKREITKDMLPNIISYPWSSDYKPVEIAYFRKYWGMRNEILREFQETDKEGYTLIETPDQVKKLIGILGSWLNKEKWDTEGDSIWEYEDAANNIIQVIINLSAVYTFMLDNPDVYLKFYDSY
jgi:hypothetical protein